MVSNRFYNRCRGVKIMVSYSNITLSTAALVSLSKIGGLSDIWPSWGI